MIQKLTEDQIKKFRLELDEANHRLSTLYPGERSDRQPIHTIYGGAHLFQAGFAQKIGRVAIDFMNQYAPSFIDFAKALDLDGFENLPSGRHDVRRLEEAARESDGKALPEDMRVAYRVYEKVQKKLHTEPVEDFRIDFEDGFGVRSNREEDETAEKAANDLADGMARKILSPFIGIRIKSFSQETVTRAIRTLDIFLSTLLEKTGGRLPQNFVITLPKVQIPEQVATLCHILSEFERQAGLPDATLKIEIMIETPQAILNPDGMVHLLPLVQSAKGRCLAAHFGTYDYTAACGVTSQYQTMDHSVCDFAKHMMKVALAGTGVFLSDGATNVMPAPIHKAKEGASLSPLEIKENTETIYRAWRLQYGHIRHSLKQAFFQGWDLHPGQLPVRYAAVFGFFLEGFESAATRLKNFMDKATQATLSGDVFDDAATGQGLINYFLRAYNCQAISEAEISQTGLTREDLLTRSFMKILERHRSI